MLLNKVKLIIRLFFAEDFGQVHETFVPQVDAIILKVPAAVPTVLSAPACWLVGQRPATDRTSG